MTRLTDEKNQHVVIVVLACIVFLISSSPKRVCVHYTCIGAGLAHFSLFSTSAWGQNLSITLSGISWYSYLRHPFCIAPILQVRRIF